MDALHPIGVVFVEGDRHRSVFILLHVAIQFDQDCLLKMLSILQYVSFISLSKIRYPKIVRHGGDVVSRETPPSR